MLRDDPNESSAVYLLTSDDKHAVCGTNFSPMQINFFAKNISDFQSRARQGKSFTDVHFGAST